MSDAIKICGVYVSFALMVLSCSSFPNYKLSDDNALRKEHHLLALDKYWHKKDDNTFTEIDSVSGKQRQIYYEGYEKDYYTIHVLKTSYYLLPEKKLLSETDHYSKRLPHNLFESLLISFQFEKDRFTAAADTSSRTSIADFDSLDNSLLNDGKSIMCGTSYFNARERIKKDTASNPILLNEKQVSSFIFSVYKSPKMASQNRLFSIN